MVRLIGCAGNASPENFEGLSNYLLRGERELLFLQESNRCRYGAIQQGKQQTRIQRLEYLVLLAFLQELPGEDGRRSRFVPRHLPNVGRRPKHVHKAEGVLVLQPPPAGPIPQVPEAHFDCGLPGIVFLQVSRKFALGLLIEGVDELIFTGKIEKQGTRSYPGFLGNGGRGGGLKASLAK